VFPFLIAIDKPMQAMLLRFVVGSGVAIAVAYLSRCSLEEIFLRQGRQPTTESRRSSHPIPATEVS